MGRIGWRLGGASVIALWGLLAVSSAASGSSRTVGERWASRLDPGLGIPAALAIETANAAIADGMTRNQVMALFNYEPFAMAISADDRGYAALEAMSEHPAWVETAYDLMKAGRGRYTVSGTTSFQDALFRAVPELRNPYLSDVGHMIATGPGGVEVLVDVETGQQVIGQGHLGRQIRAPGGGPLKAPAVSPEDAAAAMWAEAGLAPDGVTPLDGGTQGPGFTPTFSTDRGFGRTLYVFSGLALLLGLGVPAAKWAARSRPRD